MRRLLAVATCLALLLAPSVPARAATPGFHAAWLDQGAWPTLAPGATALYTLRFRNTGAETWERGVAGRQVNLAVAGDSTAFAANSLAVGWLAPDRLATTSEEIVPPDGIATFTFSVRAPSEPGRYRVDVHPVLEGVAHLEDEGAFFVVASDFGFHSRWLSQSPYPTVQPGSVSAPLTLVFRNTGTRTWVRGTAGRQANLGIDGDDRTWSALGVGWPTPDRVAIQNEPLVVPGAMATFTFQVRVPQAPGAYALNLRPMIDGVTWMEDEGVFLVVIVPGEAAAAPTLNATVTLYDNRWGRLRAAVLSPDGALYVTTSNGTDDRIIRIAPQ